MKIFKYLLILCSLCTNSFCNQTLKPIEKAAETLKRDSDNFKKEIDSINTKLKKLTSNLQQNTDPVKNAKTAIEFIKNNVPNSIIKKALNNIKTEANTLDLEQMNKNNKDNKLVQKLVNLPINLDSQELIYEPIVGSFNSLLNTIIRRTIDKTGSKSLLIDLEK